MLSCDFDFYITHYLLAFTIFTYSDCINCIWLIVSFFAFHYLCRWSRRAYHTLGRHTHSTLRTPTSLGDCRYTYHNDRNLKYTHADHTHTSIHIENCILTFFVFISAGILAVLFAVNYLFCTEDNTGLSEYDMYSGEMATNMLSPPGYQSTHTLNFLSCTSVSILLSIILSLTHS